ncbi:MAG TPA: DUF3558 domain-containing protein [Actinophytocola sp.]|uniref:DUF3558 domain-containing protein n=1 Tax=Actinophytocola sp. TaxID=1872138 RepID=UPI002DDDB2CF|nr:DUF3558 domain-containing protein [Actinophytocola sp.]HEV2783369.1 DUF3558 domain-containing protein [Actinophytocola sp.]
MSRTAFATTVLCVIAVLATSGCTESSAGNPVPGDTGSRSADGGSDGSPAPTRPRELSLAGKDPCTLIPRSDWPTFYIDKPGELRRDKTLGSPECLYLNDMGAFGLILVTNAGIEFWRDVKRSAEVTEAEPVAGFPAITVVLPGDDNRCDVGVDVAAGQYLLAGINLYDDKLSEVPEKCEYAHQWAESAVSTLAAS